MIAICVGVIPAAPSRRNCSSLAANSRDRADRQPVGAIIVLRILPDRLEIGAKDERRAVDEKDVIAGTDGAIDWVMAADTRRMSGGGSPSGERACVRRL